MIYTLDGEKEKTMDRYRKLTNDLIAAREKAIEVAHFTDDGGTCNFDGMTLHLPNWRHEKVKEAAKKSGLRCFYFDSWKCWVFNVPVPSQGNMRTAQAEAMHKVMEQLKYNTGMY